MHAILKCSRPARLLIGLDDTDSEASRGTGFLARSLAAECARRGLAPRGVTRHQFLVDPRIPYTSHNSGACVAVESGGGGGGAEAAAFAFDFVAGRAAPGSDPAVCVASAAAVPPQVLAFGREATRRVLEMAQALDLAQRAGLVLRPLGGSGLGVIGALASVGLRAEGEAGRFIDLPGLRELPGRVTLDVLVRLGIRVESPGGGRDPAAADACETLGWVRPRLVGGGPVLPVQWSGPLDAWVPVDRKHAKP
jgi:hypothetical protein